MAFLSMYAKEAPWLLSGNCLLEDYEKSVSENKLETTLLAPPFPNPCEKLKELTDSKSGIKMHFNHGTTTLGFKYQGGILVAVDSRATGGSYIGSRRVEKVVVINDYMVGTMAGGAADCTYWERVLSRQCRLYELRNKDRISVAAASKLLANMLYNYKGMGLSLGVMIAGFDKRGPNLFYVDNDGARTAGEVFSVGSGSLYAYGVLDSGYRYDLSDKEAIELGRRAIYHATHRDAASGGFIRVVHINKDGVKLISVDDSNDIHWKLVEEGQGVNQETLSL
ncbi:proteasome subunit beta type-5-like [Artemia franciscana]